MYRFENISIFITIKSQISEPIGRYSGICDDRFTRFEHHHSSSERNPPPLLRDRPKRRGGFRYVLFFSYVLYRSFSDRPKRRGGFSARGGFSPRNSSDSEYFSNVLLPDKGVLVHARFLVITEHSQAFRSLFSRSGCKAGGGIQDSDLASRNPGSNNR